MADAPVNKGQLTDKEGAGFPGCRILVDGEQQDQSFTVLKPAQPYLDKIAKKARVCFTTQDRKISRIWEDKAQPANTSEKSTSPEKAAPAGTPVNKPANNGLPKTVEGKLSFIDTEKRTLNLWREDFKLKIAWVATHDAAMAAFRQWDLVKVTYEVGEPNRLVDIVKVKTSGGWGGGKPRNEKIIVAQCLEKCYTDLYLASIPHGGHVPDFALARKTIMDAVEEDLPRLMKIGGA